MAKLHESRKIEKVDKIKHKKAKNYTMKQLFEFLQENKELSVGFEKRTQKPKKILKHVKELRVIAKCKAYRPRWSQKKSWF
mmetsp:Transcript_26298/g.40501  ORF Transcript_26298/g.40501 Transcript_26298/m.40501 type:complete len:81 (-) Transcript_26298:50-292(-)